MAIIIHHGANGSYKTSGVVQDYLIPAILEGRTVVTNIEGVSLEKAQELFGDKCHPDFDLIAVDGDSAAGRDRLLHWFHWCPPGALLIFDEAGKIFPKRLKPQEVDALSYPGGVDAAAAAGRPFHWLEAFQEHRKYNWDIVLSAPNIRAIRDDIRETSEGAYKHSNLGKLGALFRGRYREGYHDAQENGTLTQLTMIQTKKIKDPRAYALYQSTKTGIVKDTIAGKPIYKDPKLLLALACLAGALLYSYSAGGLSYFTDGPAGAPAPTPAPAARVPVEAPGSSSGSPAAAPGDLLGSTVSRETDSAALLDTAHPLEGYGPHKYRITSYTRIGGRQRYHIKVDGPSFSLTYTSDELADMGYAIRPLTRCSFALVYNSFKEIVHCGPHPLFPPSSRDLSGGLAAEGASPRATPAARPAHRPPA